MLAKAHKKSTEEGKAKSKAKAKGKAKASVKPTEVGQVVAKGEAEASVKSSKVGTVVKKAKAVMKAARNDLAALLRDPTAAVAENALAILQNCCESPAAKKLALEVLSARDQALVLNPQVVGVSY